MTILMGKEDCREDINVWDINLEGKIVVLKPKSLTERYREAKYQLVKCVGGFGCSPTASGNAIFVQEQYPGGEGYRRERYNRDFIGVATDEAIAKWKSIYLKEGGE